MLVLSTPSFNKDVSKIKDAKLTGRIEQVIKNMQSAGSIPEIGGVKKLSGSTNSYRIRIADYRLGFTVTDDTIRLIIFAHRREIYQYFP
jgi:mRNA interferase RelE/StbE